MLPRTLEPMSNDTHLRDNHSRGNVAEFLRDKIREGSKLSVVSAYFTIYAYEALKADLDLIEHMDFLFGEPTFINKLDPEKTEKKAFIIGTEGLELSNKLNQKRVARECAEWIRKKVSIKTIRQTNLLHGKMYHINNSGVEEAVVGSSNFTVKGLGLGKAGNNIELNLLVDGNRDRAELKKWFGEIWADEKLVKDVKGDVLSYLEKLYDNHSPEFIYYKTLYHLFEKFLGDTGKTDDEIGKSSLLDHLIWKGLFEFQKDGAKGVINKILRHNGCVLADSVGLGKTYTALAAIKYFELRNERVLVLCPKKLRKNWTVFRANSEQNPFLEDKFRFDVLSHTDLSRDSGMSGDIDLSSLNWGNYDLVVIDESHNFRNNTPGQKDEEGNLITKSRYQRLMDDIIRSGVKTKVLLLSATPVNNNLKDLRNQISLLTEGRDDAFVETIGVRSLKETLTAAQKVFTAWANTKAESRKTSELLEKLDATFFKLLDELTIARSRKHILKYYKNSIDKLGGFPVREKPESVCTKIDLNDSFPSYDKISDEIDGYKLSLFSPSRFVKPEHKEQYDKKTVKAFTQREREATLIGMMKVNFLKRLESSVESFEITLERTIAKIKDLEEKIRSFQGDAGKNPDSAVLEINLENPMQGEELEESLQVGGKLKYRLEHLQLDGNDGWLKALKRDKDQLQGLLNFAKNVKPETDAKLAELKRRIKAKVTKPTINKLGEPNKKVLVFTAFSDTAFYLYDSLVDWAKNELGINIAIVSGDETKTTLGRSDFDDILINFSPRAKKRAGIKSMKDVSGEIDLLIATDCISEGQNLQDCDYLVNYDIHWNPVRIIQRFGRIDRIGSVNKTVHLVNFWPTDDLNKYLDLKLRVESRMALVDLSATAEDNLLDNDELRHADTEDLRYRDKQLLRLKEEVLDIEDIGGGLSLTSFTMDDFRRELLKYIAANKEELEAAPLGLYTCVPTHADYPAIAPGVIFCFRTSGTSKESSVNPLHPYFLVYILEDGNVRLSFTQPKHILDIYRTLCSGKSVPYAELCEIFDAQTKNGTDMSPYDMLVGKAAKSLGSAFQAKAATGLLNDRGFSLPSVKDQVGDKTELELITWLVIKGA